MGLIVEVLKHGDTTDCTNNGITKHSNYLCLVNVEGPFSPNITAPAAMLVKGNMEGLVKVVPATLLATGEYKPSPKWCMFGGHMAYTGDGRFHHAVRKITNAESYGAVPIHDRIEG